MKKIAITFILAILSVSLFAQTNIKGKITDETFNEPIDFANISVFKKVDSTLMDAAYTDESGSFNIELDQNPNLFYMEIEAFGYEPKTISIENAEFLHVKLMPDKTISLDEITIVARKKAISIKGDKIIYDIDQLGIGVGFNGLETIQQLPGISLDKDENIKFRGSTGIQIMINGKKSMLQGDALREFIRNLNSNDIKSIEIISQPSARYEATGTTGILNIVLKDNKYKTLGGSIYTNGKYGKYFGLGSGGRFFFNSDKWSINASGSYYNGKSFNERFIDQTIQDENDRRNLNQDNYWLPNTESKNFTLGVERKLNKNHLISTEWQWSNQKENARTNGKTFDYLNNVLQDKVILTQKSRTPTNQISGNLFYNYTSDSLTTKIDAQVNYGYYKKSISGFQQNEYDSGEINRLDGNNNTKFNLLNAQLDWNQKFLKNLNLESGIKYSFVDMHYFNHYNRVLGNNFFIPDSLLTNDFNYRENLTSAYSQLNYSTEKWGFLVGLRMENYDYRAISHITNQTNKDNYTNWFPSASASYENENNQYRLSYSKRISRPDYLSLNPYYEYLDAYSIERGNPFLKPQIYHSFEINYIYKHTYSFGLYGYLYKDGFLNVIDYQKNENYNILYESNASKGSRFGFSSSITFNGGKWWEMQYNLDAYWGSEKSEIENYAYDGKSYGFELNMYHRFTLPKSWTITLNGFLNGRNKTPTGYSPATYDFSISLKKSFMDEKLQFALSATNILKKSMYNNYSTVNNIETHWINKWETRKFSLQITYRFGGNKDKKVKSTSLDEEKNRI